MEKKTTEKKELQKNIKKWKIGRKSEGTGEIKKNMKR